MKKFLVCTMAFLVILAGCGKGKNVAYYEESTISQEDKSVASAGEAQSEGGVRVEVAAGDEEESAKLTKSVISYYFKNENVVSVKTENFYENETAAQTAAKELAQKSQSCIEVSQNGKKVIFYASKAALSMTEGRSRDDIVNMAQQMGARSEQF